MSIAEENLNYRSTLDDSQFQAAIGRMEANVGRMTGQLMNQNGELETFAKKATDLTNRIFSLENMADFVKAIVDVRNEYQQLELSFSTILKSKTAADDLMGGLNSFAGKTPFSLKETAAAAKQLLSYGSASKDVVSELKTLGEVAAGAAIPVADLATIYGNLKNEEGSSASGIGQLANQGIPIYEELAKIMNVGKDQILGLVDSGKVGFPQIQQAFQNLTAAGGMFYGSMEAHSGTLGGQLETLSGAWDSMLNSLGQDGEGFFSGAIGVATNLVENYEKIIDILSVLIAAYGPYRVAVALTSFVQLTAVEVTAGVTLGFKLQYYWLVLVDRATKFLNATMLANPYVLVAAAVGGLIAAMYLLHDSTSAYEKSQRQLNEGNAKAAQNADELKLKVSSLNNVLQDKNATDYQQNKAYEALQAIYPRLFGNLSKEAYLRLGVVEAQKLINKENDRMSVDDLGKRYADAKNEVTSLKEELKGYYDRISEGGMGADEASKSVWSTQQALDVAVRNAADLGDEYRKHKAALDYANMSHKEKLKFLKQEKAELEAQRIVMGGFEKYYLDNDFFKNPNEAVDKALKSNAIKTEALNAPKVKTAEDIDNDKRKREQAINDKKDQDDRYSGMMQKVYGINEKYNDTFITDDQKKLDDIRKEFKALRKEIDIYNADPKNKKVNTNLEPQLEKALKGQEYQNETESINKDLEKKKALFLEYESYKSVVGEEKAKERAKSDSEIVTDYRELLETRIADTEKKPGGGVLNAFESKRLTDLKAKRDAFDAEEKSKDAAKFAEAYKAAETTAQKELAIQKDYENKVAALKKEQKREINPEQDENLIAQRDASIQATREEAYKKSEIYKKLAEETLILNREQIEKQIKTMRSLLKNSEISEEMKADVKSQLAGLEGRLGLGVDDANLKALSAEAKTLEGNIAAVKKLDINKPENVAELKRLRDKLLEVQDKTDQINKGGLDKFLEKLKDNKTLKGLSTGLNAASEAASTMSQALGGVDTEAGYTLDTIGQLAGAAGDVAGAIVSGDPLKMVGSAIKAVGTLFSIGKRVREMNEKARKEVEDFYANAIKGEREYQESIKERALQRVRDNKTALNGIKDELKIRQDQMAAWKQESDEIMGKLGGMSSIASETYKHGTWFRKAKVIKTYESLAGKDFGELSMLLSQGKLEGDAKVLVERLKELEQKGFDAEKAIADLAKQTNEIFTGTTSDNLANSLLGMFKEGKTGAQDLADFFKQTMDDAALSIFKNKVLAGAMESFYSEFAKRGASDEELTDTEISELKTIFNNLMGDAGKRFEELKKITGQDLGGSKTDSSSLTGSGTIKREITEETAGVLTGLWRGQFDMTRQMLSISTEGNIVLSSIGGNAQDLLNVARSNFDVAMKIEANTFRTADNTGVMISKLDQVIANTKTTSIQTPSDLGIKK